MLILTTIRRLALPLLVFLAWTPAAYAWSWPVQGQVLRPFSYDEAHPYTPGQHRGIDIAADAAGETVLAPAAGTVGFAGSLPTSGRSVTIDTADGYAVTLTHLGSLGVVEGSRVAEQDPIGTTGPSGTPEVDGPYLHLGIRVAADPNGYVDPLGLLPPAAATGTAGSDSSAPPASSSGGSSTTPTSVPSAPSANAPSPALASTPVTATRGSNVPHAQKPVSGRQHERVREARERPRVDRSSRRAGSHPKRAGRPVQRRMRARHRLSEPTSSSQRPVVETGAPVEPTDLDAGHEIRRSAPATRLSSPRRLAPTVPLPLVLNGAAAVVALAAALAAARGRRRRRSDTAPVAAAPVLHLPPQAVERRPASRAA